MAGKKKVKLGVLLIALGLLFNPVNSYASTYGATFENSEWDVVSSELECRIEHHIPQFGDGAFSKKAGENLSFSLMSFNNPFASGSATLVSEAPAWKPNLVSQPLGNIDVTDEQVPVYLEQPQANIILAHLNSGMMPTIAGSRLHAIDTSDWVKIEISSVNFQSAYQKYVTCLTTLLPVNFSQIARSALFFDTNKASLGGDVKKQLDLIARYVNADKSIKRIYIDGHTDDIGTKPINRSLSKRRADVVANYFKKSGVSKKIIIARFHADKYPVLKNDGEENRARNRRVTIRLQK